MQWLLSESVKARGSGFFYDSSGRVLTNAHVVDRDKNVKIQTADGVYYSGEVLGVYETLDIAVVKVDGGNFHFLSFSSDPVAGEQVAAIGYYLVGNPGEEISADFGRISAIRENIQTDAALNRGMSGGSLQNKSGEI